MSRKRRKLKENVLMSRKSREKSQHLAPAAFSTIILLIKSIGPENKNFRDQNNWWPPIHKSKNPGRYSRYWDKYKILSSTQRDKVKLIPENLQFSQFLRWQLRKQIWMTRKKSQSYRWSRTSFPYSYKDWTVFIKCIIEIRCT